MVDEAIWDFADGVVCMNLIARKDRKKSVEHQFAKVGLSNRISFLQSERSPHGGRFGSFESHLAIMKQALRDGLTNVLIFEDDAQFRDGWQENVEACRNFLDTVRKSSIPWDAFYIGGTLLWIEDVHVPCRNVVRGKLSCTHCYLISKPGMESIVEREHWIKADLKNRAHDVVVLDVWQNIYTGISPWNIKQDATSISDNLNNGDGIMEHMDPEVRTLVQNTGLYTQGLFGRLLLSFPILRWLNGNATFPSWQYAIDDGRVHLTLPRTFCDILVSTTTFLFLVFIVVMRGAPTPLDGSKQCSRMDVFRQVANSASKYFKK